jgi:hypothetical protein
LRASRIAASFREARRHWFVLRPLRILPVVVLALLPCVPPLRAHYSASYRRIFLICAACWGIFALTEANTSPNANIRVDLVLTIPACMIALIVWLASVVSVMGGKRPNGVFMIR